MNLLFPSLNFAMSALCQLRDPLRLRQRLVFGAGLARVFRGMFRHFSLMLVELKLVYARSANLESLDVSGLIFSHALQSSFCCPYFAPTFYARFGLPVASRKNLLQMRSVASFKNLLEKFVDFIAR